MGKGTQKAQADFKHRKAKVGKHKLLPTNSTEVKLKFATLGGKDAAADADGTVSLDESLRDLLKNLHNHNTPMRRDAFHSIRNLFTEHQDMLSAHLASIIHAISERMVDPEDSVRGVLAGFVGWLVEVVESEAVLPFIPLFIAHVVGAVSNLNASVRLDALTYIVTFVEAKPDLIPVFRDGLLSHLEALLQGGGPLVCTSILPSIMPQELKIGNATGKTLQKWGRVKLSSLDARVCVAWVMSKLLGTNANQALIPGTIKEAYPCHSSVLLAPPRWHAASIREIFGGAVSDDASVTSFPKNLFCLCFGALRALLHITLEMSPSELHAADVHIIRRVTQVCECMLATFKHAEGYYASVKMENPFQAAEACVPLKIADHVALKQLASIDAATAEPVASAQLLLHCLHKQIFLHFPITASSTDDTSAGALQQNAVSILNSVLCNIIAVCCSNVGGAEETEVSELIEETTNTSTANPFMSLLPQKATEESIQAVSDTAAVDTKRKRPVESAVVSTTAKRARLDADGATEHHHHHHHHHDYHHPTLSLFLDAKHAIPVSVKGFWIRADMFTDAAAATVSAPESNKSTLQAIKKTVQWCLDVVQEVTGDAGGRISDSCLNSSPGCAIPAILECLPRFIALGVERTTMSTLLRCITDMFTAAPAKSALKSVILGFVLGLLKNPTAKISTVINDVMPDWLMALPKCMWGLGNTRQDLICAMLDVLIAYTRRTSRASKNFTTLINIVRQLAPIFFVYKAGADGARQGHFGAFLTLDGATQRKLWVFLSAVGGITPPLRRGILTCALKSESLEAIKDALDCLQAMQVNDMCGGLPVALVDGEIQKDMLCFQAANALSLLLGSLVEHTQTVSGCEFTIMEVFDSGIPMSNGSLERVVPLLCSYITTALHTSSLALSIASALESVAVSHHNTALALGSVASLVIPHIAASEVFLQRVVQSVAVMTANANMPARATARSGSSTLNTAALACPVSCIPSVCTGVNVAVMLLQRHASQLLPVLLQQLLNHLCSASTEQQSSLASVLLYTLRSSDFDAFWSGNLAALGQLASPIAACAELATPEKKTLLNSLLHEINARIH